MRNAPVIQSASNASTINLPAVPVNQAFYVSAQVIQGDSSAAGTVKLQASNDLAPAGQLATFTPTNWSDISGATATVTSGGTVLIPTTIICYQWIRAVWTVGTPGSTTITVEFNVQSI